MVVRKEPKERIKELISKGYSKIQTIRAMRNEGYGPREVDNAMNDFLSGMTGESEGVKPSKAPEKEVKQEEPKAETTYRADSLSRQVELLRKQVEEDRKKMDMLLNKDISGFKKIREREIEDVVNFQAKLEKMHEQLKETSKEMVEQMNDFRSQMVAFEKKMEGIKSVEDDIKKLDLKEIRREIEILKTKDHWIEDNLEKLDVGPLMEKIKEVEHKIDGLKATSPFVIE